jgi:hypothetical protein
MHNAPPTEEQWIIIKDHLSQVFLKRTPDRNPAPNKGTLGNTITPIAIGEGFQTKPANIPYLPPAVIC